MKYLVAFTLLISQARADITGGLQLWMKMNETSGATIVDSTGGASGTMTGAYTTIPAPSNFPGRTAIMFASANLNGIQVADRPGLRASTAGWTWATWIYLPATMTDARALWVKNPTAFNTEYEIYSSDQAAWNVVRSGSTIINHQFNTPDFAVGSWKHVAVVSTYSATNNLASTYYLSGNAPVTFGPNNWGGITPDTTNIQIGRRNNGGTMDIHINAAFSDMRFYNRPLSASDVAELVAYTEGSASIVPLLVHMQNLRR